MVALVGASGSGKSTLMNIIGLLDKADSGSYVLGQRDIVCLSSDETADLRNQKISFVFQQFNLLPRFTALQNVTLPLTYRKMPTKIMEEQASIALARVNMHNYTKHKPSQLSGGQQQRVAIARALVTNPSIILADEPTGALDSRTSAEVMDLFLHLNAEGCTILLVTHDHQVAAHCKRRITLCDGKIASEFSQ
jgi:putative ABC transport system ATP-binding protein